MEILQLYEHDDFISEGAGHHGMSALIDLAARNFSQAVNFAMEPYGV